MNWIVIIYYSFRKFRHFVVGYDKSWQFCLRFNCHLHNCFINKFLVDIFRLILRVYRYEWSVLSCMRLKLSFLRSFVSERQRFYLHIFILMWKLFPFQLSQISLYRAVWENPTSSNSFCDIWLSFEMCVFSLLKFFSLQFQIAQFKGGGEKSLCI